MTAAATLSTLVFALAAGDFRPSANLRAEGRGGLNPGGTGIDSFATFDVQLKPFGRLSWRQKNGTTSIAWAPRITYRVIAETIFADVDLDQFFQAHTLSFGHTHRIGKRWNISVGVIGSYDQIDYAIAGIGRIADQSDRLAEVVSGTALPTPAILSILSSTVSAAGLLPCSEAAAYNGVCPPIQVVRGGATLNVDYTMSGNGKLGFTGGVNYTTPLFPERPVPGLDVTGTDDDPFPLNLYPARLDGSVATNLRLAIASDQEIDVSANGLIGTSTIRRFQDHDDDPGTKAAPVLLDDRFESLGVSAFWRKKIRGLGEINTRVGANFGRLSGDIGPARPFTPLPALTLGGTALLFRSPRVSVTAGFTGSMNGSVDVILRTFRLRATTALSLSARIPPDLSAGINVAFGTPVDLFTDPPAQVRTDETVLGIQVPFTHVLTANSSLDFGARFSVRAPRFGTDACDESGNPPKGKTACFKWSQGLAQGYLGYSHNF